MVVCSVPKKIIKHLKKNPNRANNIEIKIDSKKFKLLLIQEKVKRVRLSPVEKKWK